MIMVVYGHSAEERESCRRSRVERAKKERKKKERKKKERKKEERKKEREFRVRKRGIYSWHKVPANDVFSLAVVTVKSSLQARRE